MIQQGSSLDPRAGCNNIIYHLKISYTGGEYCKCEYWEIMRSYHHNHIVSYCQIIIILSNHHHIVIIVSTVVIVDGEYCKCEYWAIMRLGLERLTFVSQLHRGIGTIEVLHLSSSPLPSSPLSSSPVSSSNLSTSALPKYLSHHFFYMGRIFYLKLSTQKQRKPPTTNNQ